MRIDDDYKKSVVFFGFEDEDPGKGGINCVGTGFLVHSDGGFYLVTAGHVAQQLGGDPFLIRINRKDGSAATLHADLFEWLEHPDPYVDLAAHCLVIPDQEYEAVYLDADREFLSSQQALLENIGVGSLTYTIGLFSLLSGRTRNLAVCHHGNVALLPSDEKIPVVDWRDQEGKKHVYLEAELLPV